VGLVFRDILYSLGRWAGGGGLLGVSPRQFGSTADDTIYTLVLFLRPAIPWKCGLVRSREDPVLSRVLVV